MAEATALRNNALPYPVYGVPWTLVFPILDADGDPVTGAAGLDSEVSKNGDTPADCTNEATEIGTSGSYYLTLTGAEMTADVVSGVTKTSASGAKTTSWVLYPRKLVSLRTGTAAGGDTAYITLDASAGANDDTWNGCLCVAVIDTLTEARIIADYTGSNQRGAVTPAWNVAPDSDDTFTIYLPEGMQRPVVNALQVNGTVQTARDLGASVLLSSGTGTGQISLSSGEVTPTTASKTGYALSTAGIQAIWDAATSALTTAGSIGKALVDLCGRIVGTLLTGNHTAQTGDAYARLGAPAGASVSADVAAVKSDTAAILVDTGTDGVVLPQAQADKVWGTATRVLTAGTNIALAKGTGVTGFNDLDAAGIRAAVGLASANLDTQLGALPTAAENADAAWDEAISGHLGAGSMGAALNAAGSAGDPWSTPLPGAYGAGTAGKLIGDNINAPIATVDTVVDGLATELAKVPKSDGAVAPNATAIAAIQSGLATTSALAMVATYVDTEVAAIKAKTDNLPSDPADQSAVEAAITAATSGLSTLNAAGVRTAVGLASANLDTQLSGVAAAVWAYVLEGSTTAVQFMRGIFSSVVCKVSGALTTTMKFRDIADTKDRITATVDENGNRPAITLDLT